MGRKHGFRGTPVRPPRGPATIGRVFEQRGDPMVTAREGREKFGRNLDTEDPDFDRYFAEKRQEELREERLASALLKPHQVDKGESFRKSIASRSTAQELADKIRARGNNRLIAMNYQARKRIINIPEPKRDEPAPPDNVPATVLGHDKSPSREKQTPGELSKRRSFFIFTKTDAPLPKLKKRKKRRKK